MVGFNIQIKNAKIISEKHKKQFQDFIQESNVQRLISEKEKKAYEKGLSEGKEIGFNERNEEVKNLIETLLESIKKLHDTKYEILNLYEPEVVKLATLAAQKIIYRELESSASKIEFVVKDILNKLPGATMIKIKLNPEDLNALVNVNTDLLQEASNVSLEFIKDNSITSGGCYVESDVGDVDALVETRIDNMKNEINGNNE